MNINGKITVIKIGGSLLEGNKFKSFLRVLSNYARRNPAIIVHGGGKEITALSNRLGLKNHFVNGLRHTDAQTMEAVEMALCGKVNPFIVDQLQTLGTKAVGISGRNARVVIAKRIPSLGLVGKPCKVDTAFISMLMSRGYTPVISPIASDGKGNALNINADDMASAVATSLKARRLILFTDVPGILDSRKKTISHVANEAQADTLIKDNIITGGMIPKIKSAFHALKKGVGEIWILEGKLPLKNARGTLLTKQKSARKRPFA